MITKDKKASDKYLSKKFISKLPKTSKSIEKFTDKDSIIEWMNKKITI